MAEVETVVETNYSNEILSSVGFEVAPTSSSPLVLASDAVDQADKASYASRMMTAITYAIANMQDGEKTLDQSLIERLIDRIDGLLVKQVAEITQHEDFRNLEKNWRGVYDLAQNVDFNKTKLSILDAGKDELQEDFEGNAIDISSSDLFQKLYTAEYDQFGGEPFGSIVGLYEFDRSEEDIEWLTVMGKISETSHAPFTAAASPKLLDCKEYKDLAEIKDIDGLMAHPKFGRWNEFRKTRAAAYIGLTLPRYMVRAPYDPDSNPARKGVLTGFKENINMDAPASSCLWGNAAIPFAKNLIRAFQQTGWCQSICGPTSGGMVSGMQMCHYNERDPNAYVLPVDFLIPDQKEYGFAKAGLMSMVYEKGTSNACFFSAQSVKLAEEFVDDADSENSQMATKLAYTYSTCRIAHYVKCMMRDAIGSEDDDSVISTKLNGWITNYVNGLPNPSALSKSFYPFKAANISVEKKSGMVGWYNCHIDILPHIKFEGMDVSMKIDTRLG